ncbi:MAG: CopG family transcriptional regulator [Actinomycetota bacterium]|jgi:hypothetical protein|nr:CopG family transcriptional regulator [Actinomycetota bacterium]
MTHPISVRFRDERVAERLKTDADVRATPTSALAEELIDEGLRTRRHPLVSFRDGAAGRRVARIGGSDIWEVVGGIVGGDVPVTERVRRAIKLFGLTNAQVDAVPGDSAEFADEVDDEIAANERVAKEAEALWRRRQDLLAR